MEDNGAVNDAKIRLGQGHRSIEDAVHYSIAHRIRAEILAILNEGIHTPDDLSKMIGEPLSKTGHHIKELLEDGSIELACIKSVRNTLQHFYRAVEVPFYSDEEVAAMPPEGKQAIIGLILESVVAEALASFNAGKMVEDPRIWLSWRWFNVDDQGRDDIADEQARHWARVQEIEAESTERRIETGEDARSVIVTSMGYIRSRAAPNPPRTRSEKPD